MRELTVRIRFTSPCLGSVKRYVKDPKTGQTWPVFMMPRTPAGKVRFETSWWKSSLAFAATVLCKHQRAVEHVHFDLTVDGRTESNPDKFFKRYFNDKAGGRSKSRFVKHEAFLPEDLIGINCVVPDEISDEEFWQLLDIVGRFKGISPYGPREYGQFEVDAIRPKIRRPQPEDHAATVRERAAGLPGYSAGGADSAEERSAGVHARVKPDTAATPAHEEPGTAD